MNLSYRKIYIIFNHIVNTAYNTQNSFVWENSNSETDNSL